MLKSSARNERSGDGSRASGKIIRVGKAWYPRLALLLVGLAAIAILSLIYLTIPAEARQAATIAGGYSHSLGIRTDGSVVAWGDNSNNECFVPVGLSGVVAVAPSKGWHNLALKADGTVVAWGDNTYGQRNVPAGLNLRLRFRLPGSGNAPLKLLLMD